MDEFDLRALLQAHASRHSVPGAAVGILRDGVATTAYCGVADVTIGDLMQPLFGITVPPLRLGAAPGAAGDLSRFAGVYAWPDRRVEISATSTGLLMKTEHGETEGLPLDERTFLIDALNPDNPAATFGAFDAAGRPRLLYLMLWGLPRVDE